jgi:hypothetical protein
LEEEAGTGEPISRSPYTAKLLGSSDEELASRDFFRLVEAIRWLTDAEENGALARRAGIFSSKGELVWARLFAAKDEQRERVMKYNAARILVQIDDLVPDDSPRTGATEVEDLQSEDLQQIDDPPRVGDLAQFDDRDDWARLNDRRSGR